VLGLVILMPLLTRVFRGQVDKLTKGHRGSDMLDIWIIRGSICFDLLGYIGYAFTPSGAVMVLAGMVAALGGLGPPTIQSSLTKHIPADRTGQILGAAGLLHALARVVAPTVFNLIYMETVGVYAGLVFICLASIFVLVFVLSWFLKPKSKSYRRRFHSVQLANPIVQFSWLSRNSRLQRIKILITNELSTCIYVWNIPLLHI
jgi:hypothetical protein